ncbi:S-layer homology domain-containing protein [Lysinibacillus sp. NPDC097231]|uniref:S-layer homology domain-containing protein n=1 Tax=Lysinibacillus sp. NPDC097231 TaxID=3364142 RepID=UPI0038173930
MKLKFQRMISFFVAVVLILTMIPYHPLEVRAADAPTLNLGTPVKLSEKVYQLSDAEFDKSGVVNEVGGYFTVSVNNGVTAVGSLPSGITELTNGITISGVVTDESTETNRVFNFSSGTTYENIQNVIQNMVFTSDLGVTQHVTVTVVPGAPLENGKTSIRTYNGRHFVYVERLTTMTFKDAVEIATSNNGHLVEPAKDKPAEMLDITKLFKEFATSPYKDNWNFISFIGATKTTAQNWDSPKGTNTKYISNGELTGLESTSNYVSNGGYSHLTLLLDEINNKIGYLGVENTHGGSSSYKDPGVIVEYNSGAIEIITATKDLILVDKTALSNKITEVEDLTKTDYTPNSWTALQNELEAALAVFDNPNAEQAEVDAALTALNNARQALQPFEVKTPGGIDSNKLSLWVKADSTATDENVTAWKDETNSNQFTAQGTPKIAPSSVNFNPSVTFDGYSYFEGKTSIKMAEAFTVAMWNGNKNGPTAQNTKGTIISSIERKVPGDNAMYFFWNKSDENKLYAGASPYNLVPSPVDNVYNLWNAAQSVYEKDGGSIGGTVGNNPTFTGTPQIGKRNNFTGDTGVANINGNIAEIITLNGKADATERSKVDSYLALKYGITLNNGASNYVDTNNSTVWTIDTTYKNNIAGIARDDAEGLYQKQSHSINAETQVVIGLDTLVDTNAANNGTLTDRQYLVWGDNNATLKFTKQIGTTDKNHSERIWKVQNTGDVGEVNIAIPKNTVPINPTLLVGDSDTDLTNATPYTMAEATFAGDTYYVAKVSLTNGQFFTFAADVPVPQSVKVEEITTNQNQIVVTFDKAVELTASKTAGFTVTVEGIPVTLTDADFKVDPADSTKLLITLPSGIDITGKSVKVEYNGQGNLTGTNKVPVNAFDKDITLVDKTKLQQKVDEEGTLTEGNYTPASWSKYQEELVKAQAVLTSPTATQEEVDTALAALTAAQGSLNPTSPVVDKTKLQQKVDEEGTLTEENYTPASWSKYQEELVKAQAVLTSPMATQEEVDTALAALTAAQGSLVPTSPVVDKTKLQQKVDEEGTLTEGNYTPASWSKYQEELVKAQAVLTDPAATQEEVDEALAALTAAQGALVPTSPVVDKTKLQQKVDEEGTLTEGNYTPASWNKYQEELVKAQAVLTDPAATQEEVDEALAALTAAQGALVPTSPVVDKTKLQQKVDEEGTLTEGNYTPASWNKYQEELVKAQAVLTDPAATQEEVDEALATLTATQNALVKKPTAPTSGLGSLIPSTGALNPSFSSEVTNYTMNVGYATSQLSFLATPSNPGATVTMTVNGQVVTNGLVPLQIGANTVVITVQDGTGVKQYTITVYRAADSSNGSGGGGTWTPAPTPTPPTTTETGTTTTKIQVALEIDGNNPLEKTTVEIERTKHANGEITDFVALTEVNAREAVEKAKQIGNNIVRIVIPDINDEVDKVTVEIPKQSLQLLRDNGLSLEIATENGLIAIPLSSMDGVNDNFYFRLVPVKKESERKAIEERARVEKVVRETLQSNDVRVVARPMTIETNMPSRPVQVTLPLRGVKVPSAAAERQEFLKQLAVFIEHSDGEKKVVFPEVVTMANGELGLRFTVEKFSTFTIIQFENTTVDGEHEAYIKGFQDGTFGPEKNVTRAQVAIMMARILGYTEGQTVNKAPFKDVAKDHSVAGAIAFVKEQGIMYGDEHGNFHASQNITRAEMAAVVANYKQLSVEQGGITFKDTKGHWAQWIIEANRAAGIINGLQDGSFGPNAYLTRAQAVVMMNRMFERGPLNGVATPSFTDVKATHWAFKEIEEAAKSHSYFIDENDNEQLLK